jgi:hypothetical protein
MLDQMDWDWDPLSRKELLAAIGAWAETYYPARAGPPPPGLSNIRLSDAELTVCSPAPRPCTPTWL